MARRLGPCSQAQLRTGAKEKRVECRWGDTSLHEARVHHDFPNALGIMMRQVSVYVLAGKTYSDPSECYTPLPQDRVDRVARTMARHKRGGIGSSRR